MPNVKSLATALMTSAWFAEAISYLILLGVFGGKLPKNRATLIAHEEADSLCHEVVLRFPKPHRARRRATAASSLAVISLASSEGEEVENIRLVGPKAR